MRKKIEMSFFVSLILFLPLLAQGNADEKEEVPHWLTEGKTPTLYYSKSASSKKQPLTRMHTGFGSLLVSTDEGYYSSSTSGDVEPPFLNAKHSFIGNLQAFVSFINSDGRSKIISAVPLEYSSISTAENPSLSTVGIVHLNEKGIVGKKNVKSGWVNMYTSGSYTNTSTGKSEEIRFDGVSFWVNEGGDNWWDFEVKKASVAGQETEVTAKIEQVTTGINRPVIIIVEGKYKLVPRVISLSEITFVEEKRPPQKQKATIKSKKK